MSKLSRVARKFELKLAQSEPLTMLKGDAVSMGDPNYIGVLTGKIKQRGPRTLLFVIFPDKQQWVPNSAVKPASGDSWSSAVSEVLNSDDRALEVRTINPGHYAITGVNKTVEWKANNGAVAELKVHNQAVYF